jgi:hypothetical protein
MPTFSPATVIPRQSRQRGLGELKWETRTSHDRMLPRLTWTVIRGSSPRSKVSPSMGIGSLWRRQASMAQTPAKAKSPIEISGYLNAR